MKKVVLFLLLSLGVSAQSLIQHNFKTLSDMKNANLFINLNTVAIVMGFSSSDDGKGGMYWFNTSIGGSGNSFDTIRPQNYIDNAVNGAWVRYNLWRNTAYDNVNISEFKIPIANITGLQSSLNSKFNTPLGTSDQYIKGDGTLGSSVFPVSYSGTTNSSGTFTVTYPTAYSVTPNVQFQIVGGSVTNTIRLTSSTTTGFTVYVQNRVDVVGLLPSYTNVNGATVDVLVTKR